MVRFQFLIAALLSALPVLAASPETPGSIVAVLDLEPRGGLSAQEVLAISDRLRGELLATGVFTVVERNQMESILTEQGFQQTGVCSDATCIVEVGQLLAVNKMVGGSIGRIGDAFTVNLKLIDVATGTIDRQVSADVKCTIQKLVADQVRLLARRMAGLEKEKVPLTRRWFFWVPLGAALAGGVAIAIIAGGGDDAADADGATRTVDLSVPVQ